MDWFLSWDVVQTILAFLSLFAGGYTGGRASGVQRIRFEERKNLWKTLPDIDVALRSAEELCYKGGRRLSMIHHGKRPPTYDEQGYSNGYSLNLREVTSAVSTFRSKLSDIESAAQLLSWTERITFDQYHSSIKHDSVDAAARFVQLEEQLGIDRPQKHHEWADYEDEDRKAGDTMLSARVTDVDEAHNRNAALVSLRSHLHRRLRPAWWRQPRDWVHSAHLGVLASIRQTKAIFVAIRSRLAKR